MRSGYRNERVCLIRAVLFDSQGQQFPFPYGDSKMLPRLCSPEPWSNQPCTESQAMLINEGEKLCGRSCWAGLHHVQDICRGESCRETGCVAQGLCF